MKHLQYWAAAFLAGLVATSQPAYSQSNEILERIEGPVVNAHGTATELTQKAHLCMARLLRNQSADGSPSGLFLFSDDTTIIANSQIDYSHRMLRRSVKSKVTFEAREGRFRITHTEIGGKIHSTTGGLGFGASIDDGTSHSVIYKNFGTGWEEAQKQLQNLSGQIATCVSDQTGDDW